MFIAAFKLMDAPFFEDYSADLKPRERSGSIGAAVPVAVLIMVVHDGANTFSALCLTRTLNMAITLYGFDGSTYVRTVRMLLAEKGAHYEQVPVNVLQGEPHSSEHLARHPFGKVPVLDHDGFRIIETSAIAPYLDEVLPGPSFVPDNAKDQARMRMAMGIVDSYGYGALVG